MEEEQIVEEALICTILVTAASAFQENEVNKKRKRRSIWVRKFIQQRTTNGAHFVTVAALRENDPYSFRRYLRMSSDVYEVFFYAQSFNFYLFGTLSEQEIFLNSKPHCMTDVFPLAMRRPS